MLEKVESPRRSTGEKQGSPAQNCKSVSVYSHLKGHAAQEWVIRQKILAAFIDKPILTEEQLMSIPGVRVADFVLVAGILRNPVNGPIVSWLDHGVRYYKLRGAP